MKQFFLSILLVFFAMTGFSANDHEIVIVYQGATATVNVAEDVSQFITVDVNGADVTVEQDDEVADEITYRLMGQTDNGSFVHKGDFKITLSLEGLQLASQTGAAMQIKNGKRIAIVLKDGTENALTDKEGGDQKACMTVKGHCEFQGGGLLTINGRGKHALKSNEYVEVKATTGRLSLFCTMKDGIHTDEFVLVKGGVLDITTTGGGYWDEEDSKTKAPSCINAVGSVTILGGTLNLLSTGDGGKGVSSDSCFVMSGGSMTVRTQGRRYISDRYEGDLHDIDAIPDSLKNSPKAVKSDLGIGISGGRVSLYTDHDGGEGLESKDTLVIRDGDIHIEAYDDCINAAGNVRIHGGDLFLNSLDNDGIDTNQSMFITGGNIVTLGNYLHELGIDVNDKSPYKKLYLTGGTIVCVGGTSQISHPAATDGAQPALYYKGKVNAGTSLLLRQTSDGADVLRYLLERDYTAEAGGRQPDLCLMFSSPMLRQGKGYELIDETTGTPLASVTSLSELYSDMEANEARFSRETFSLGSNTLSYREADICHDGMEKPILVLYLHGGSARGDDNEAQLREAAVSVIYQYLYSRQIPATLIVPQCPSGGGWTGQLRKVVNELMKRKSNDGAHDANRVYVMGGSMGGTGTWAQLSHFPDFYAAAMPVAGNPTGLDAENVATTPVLTVMGTADNMMSIPSVEQFQTEVLAVGGTLILEIEQGWSHPTTCEQSYTDQRLDWLFSNVRGDEDCVSSPSGIEGNQVVYDLSGRRVSCTGKGIYIVGGRKVVIK